MAETSVHIFPVVILHGSPFERGQQHGKRFRQRIAASIAEMEAEHGANGMAAARRVAEATWPVAQEVAPAVAAEIKGIAEGADRAVTDIFLRCGFEFFALPATTGCTAIALKGQAGAIVAQNWDAPPEASADLALFIHVGPDGFERAIVASYGGLGWVGCNRHGLAMVNNDLILRSSTPGLPSQIVRRLILEQPTVSSALDRMASLTHMGGRSYLLGDASGDVAGVEVSAQRGMRVNQRSSPVTHTNHALDPHIADDEDEAMLMKTYPSSRRRYHVLQGLAARASCVDDVTAILRNKEGSPNSICKDPSEAEKTRTDFSLIVDCGNRTLYFCPGSPAEQAYRPFSWAG